jgi:hypothetical protein
LPLPAVLQIIDSALARYLNTNLDLVFPAIPGTWVGARPGTQALDIAHGLHLVIEKGLDMRSRAALGQEDIQAFYDTMKMLRIARFLEEKGIPKAHAAVFLRHQLLPRVLLSFGGPNSVEIKNRSSGGLTGSRLAGAFGRVPVESVISERHTFWREHGFLADDAPPLTLCTYVDNVYTASPTLAGAVFILEDFEKSLNSRWGQVIKQSSRSVMLCSGLPDDATICNIKWPRVTEFNCLGHVLQNNSSIRSCFTNTKANMWKAFWGNCGHDQLRDAPVATKCKLLDRSCKSVLAYRCSRWPPQPTIAKELDRVQTKMIAAIVRTPRTTGESDAEYSHRRNFVASRICAQNGRWSDFWYQRSIGWDEHLSRGHCVNSWPVLLHDFHNNEWLQGLRFSRASRASNTSTNTRVSVGRPPMRWHDGISFAKLRVA